MNLGVFLSPGESFRQMKKTGQDQRFVESYIKPYSKHFGKVYIFSYKDEDFDLPSNTFIVANKTGFPRLIYAFLLPLLHFKKIGECDVVRGFGLASSLSSILLTKPFVFNWAYDYLEFVKLQNKIIYVPAYFFLEIIAFLKAKKVFIATKSKFDKLKGAKYVYLPNGVDANLFTHDRVLGSGMVYVGRLEKQKNLFSLLNAISLLPVFLRKVTFIGSGSQKESLKKYARQKRIKLTIIPPVLNSQLPGYLSRFSIFVLPSFAEGSPKALQEAMSLGLVPVVNDFKTAKEVITDKKDGFIINFSEDQFAKHIQLLLGDKKLREQMSKEAALKISNNFDIRLLVQKEIEIFKEVAA